MHVGHMPVYLWVDFDVFCLAGATRYTGGGEIYSGKVDRLIRAKFCLMCAGMGCGTPQTVFF